MNCLNEYKVTFVVRCPGNKKKVHYKLRIKTSSTIMVERICEAVGAFTDAYHESIADELVRLFGGRQILVAHHHGVDIKTIRSSNEA